MEEVKISSKVGPGVYIKDAKSALSTKGSVQLSALEFGISNACHVANALVNDGCGKITRFETSLLENDGNTGQYRGLTKVTIKLEKTSNPSRESKDTKQ